MMTKERSTNVVIGQEFLEKQLKSIGFSKVEFEGSDGDALYLVAVGDKSGIFIKAKVLSPNSRVTEFTTKDEEDVIKRAIAKHLEPWTVIVVLNNQKLLNSIKWRDLSKS